MRLVPFAIICVLVAACSKQPTNPPTTTPETTDAPADPPPVDGADGNRTERTKLTSAECEAQGGKIVGDIGDGAIHRPDYKCESGAPPVGTIVPDPGGPTAVEGAVCCK